MALNPCPKCGNTPETDFRCFVHINQSTSFSKTLELIALVNCKNCGAYNTRALLRDSDVNVGFHEIRDLLDEVERDWNGRADHG